MYLANKLSLSLMARNSRCSDSIGSSMDLSPWGILTLTDQRQHRTRGQSNIYDYLVCFEPNIKSYSTHTHPFNGPLSGTTRVSQYQKCKTNLDFTEAKECVAVASAGPYASVHFTPDRQPCQYPTTQFFTGRMPFPSPN